MGWTRTLTASALVYIQHFDISLCAWCQICVHGITKEEYDLLVCAKKDEMVLGKPKLAGIVSNISTPAPCPGAPDVKLNSPRFQSRPRLNLDTSHNMISMISGPYVPKLPVHVFSGSEELQKGEASYEVWKFEMKCLQTSSALSEHLLLQAIWKYPLIPSKNTINILEMKTMQIKENKILH